MAIGKRPKVRQEEWFVATSEIRRLSHPFYRVLERVFPYLLQTGALRRVLVRGQDNIRKRLLIHAAAFNLGLLMRQRYGVGTPRSLQGRAAASAATLRH